MAGCSARNGTGARMTGVCEGEGDAKDRAFASDTQLITEGISSLAIDGGGFRAFGDDLVGDSMTCGGGGGEFARIAWWCRKLACSSSVGDITVMEG